MRCSPAARPATPPEAWTLGARLTAKLLVTGLIRSAESAGGQAMVLARGDETAGAILLITMEKGEIRAILERAIAPDGRYKWVRAGPANSGNLPINQAAVDEYIGRRRRSDPDIWVVELNIADAERFAAETTGDD